LVDPRLASARWQLFDVLDRQNGRRAGLRKVYPLCRDTPPSGSRSNVRRFWAIAVECT
jgi:hypothetical protein